MHKATCIVMSHQKEYVRRLRKELENILKDPPPNIQALPSPQNILEWHYVITGPQGTPYEGGLYHGKLKFPDEYPHKPPSILMYTPSGRFKPNTRLCFSMSDFHPETWNPMWSVSSILTGLLSFMLSDENNYGSMTSTDAEKRKYASYSMDFNRKNPTFVKMFPELLEAPQEDDDEPDMSPSETKKEEVAPPPETEPAKATTTHAVEAPKFQTPAKPPKESGSVIWLFAAVAIIVGVFAMNRFT